MPAQDKEHYLPGINFTMLSHPGTESAEAMVQRSLATASMGSRPCCQPRDAGFTVMANARAMGSRRLIPRFQRKA